jgi:hypothetical protein
LNCGAHCCCLLGKCINTMDVRATLFGRLCSLRGKRSYAPVVMVTIVSVLSVW